MINILLREDKQVDVINVKQTFKKVNIINPVHPLYILCGNRRQPPKVTVEQHLILQKDLKMPKTGGIEFPQKLSSEPQLRATPVVVMTVSNQVQ
ncbi:hypothetical protein [Nostoc sp.]|uniref:hypothetical protein n=1 Tax=Nostoc sp. TaxID=1180 RepID=UPI002FFADF87